MGILTDLLKEVPLSSVLMEKIKAFEIQVEKLERQLEDCRRLHDMRQNENRVLMEKLNGIGRFHKGVRFRKNIATGQEWIPFCPVCDTVLQVLEPPYSRFGLHCPKPKCGFSSSFPSSELEKVTAEIVG